MPNVGKSTLFNALVKKQLALASNFPFATIKPNTADALVPDARLPLLARWGGSAAVIPWSISIKDIAGLIAGASKGEGLGNAFLADVRESSAILQVVRCFDDSDIIHVLDHPDPLRDIAIIELELVLADAQSVEKRLPAARKGAGKSPEAAATARFLEAAQPLLESGHPVRLLEHTVSGVIERRAWDSLQLLTQKPMMLVCNVGEGDMAEGNAMSRAVAEYASSRAVELSRVAGVSVAPSGVAIVSAKVEAELALLADEEERLELLGVYGLSKSGMDKLLEDTAKLLRLQAYFTQGPLEARAWAIPCGATAVTAAGAIHSDFEKLFVSAEVVGWEELVASGGNFAQLRAAGRVRAEGAGYVMRDGDVVEFRLRGQRK